MTIFKELDELKSVAKNGNLAAPGDNGTFLRDEQRMLRQAQAPVLCLRRSHAKYMEPEEGQDGKTYLTLSSAHTLLCPIF